MVIEKLTMLNFRNYEHVEFNFSPSVNLLTGLNGSGKTNMLDAIHYISLTRSAFNKQESNNVRMGTDFFSIRAQVSLKEEEYQVLCSFTNKEGKVLKVNKNICKKVSEHIGRFPVVLITPYDTDLIREGSEGRRKFFDAIISQLNPAYLKDLIVYSQLLKQRNAVLRSFYETGKTDLSLLEYFNKEMLRIGKDIFEARDKFMGEFIVLFYDNYQFLTSSSEEISLSYASEQRKATFEQEFIESLDRDIQFQRTTKGIHKDDYIFTIYGKSLKNYGSQGQQKSYILALKIAQYQLMIKYKGFKPVLLMDDIFDKLDTERISRLLALVSSSGFGQLFITDARIERSETYLREISSDLRIFKIHKGSILDNAQ
jgi:DNA replication and repair protein RecF